VSRAVANFKRKRCRRSVRCTLCTADRWKGNGKDRFKVKDSRRVLNKDQKEQEE
jgi:hypothetical protein